MMAKFLSLALIGLTISTLFSSAQTPSDKFHFKAFMTAVDSVLENQVKEGKIPGAVILVKKGDNIVARKAYGFASRYDYNGKALSKPGVMTINHLFDLASLTKVVGTTTSIMLLYDRGLLNVDDHVGKYLPGFDTPEKKEITLRHLLTHTAGLTEWYPLYYRCSDKFQTYKLIEDLPLKYPVGSRRSYSDLGFVILGEIVEKISGLALDKFMADNIFEPLGMKNTLFNPLLSSCKGPIVPTSHGNPYENRMVSDSTLGYKMKEIDPSSWQGWRKYTLRGEVNDGNTWYACGGISGAAGLFSTADDLEKLVGMLMNHGVAESRQFISGKTIDTFLSPDRFSNGLGWMMDPSNSFMKHGPEGTFGHTGFTGTSITVIPSDEILVILLINRQNTGLDKTGEYYNVNPVRLKIFNSVMKYLR